MCQGGTLPIGPNTTRVVGVTFHMDNHTKDLQFASLQLPQRITNSSKHSRSYLEELGQQKRIRYIRLLEICSEHVGRKLKDISELDNKQIREIIEKVKNL